MGAIALTGQTLGRTSLNLTAGTVTKSVPVTVTSRNILSYGPATGNGLTATVNTDGSLHVTGTATKQWSGLGWKFPVPYKGTATLSVPATVSGLSVSVKCLDAAGQIIGTQIQPNTSGQIPDTATHLRLDILCSQATPTAVTGDMKIQLEAGNSAHPWMKPDNTSLNGGGV
ncbi:hypothetical protein [Bifidobacterium aerophilum]|uniref:Uncharacterized protein n=1 Tax=Bifidobacterium aerophilum TaxID=1798155 RepID=A0A6N9Z7X7_9BIFI|nr:hypothetical protein [Bifidobacterium aerophilum]NEG90611.1 hypothetical protein [Bifidobacterium aerophilum]